MAPPPDPSGDAAPNVPAPQREGATAPKALRLRTTPKQPRRWGRLAFGLLGLGIVASIVVALWPSPIPVDLVQAGRGPMEVTVEEDGRTRVRDRYEVAAPVAGTLLRVELKPGDSVRQGTVVARLWPPAPPLLDPRARAEAAARVAAAVDAVSQTRTELKRAEDALAFATRDAARLQELFKENAVSEQARDQAELVAKNRAEELASAQFGAQVAEHELEVQRSALAQLTSSRSTRTELPLRAPVDGVVLAVRRESEGPVAAGQPVLEIGDPAALEIEVDLLTADAARVVPGAPALIESWGGAGVLRGHVHRVEPSAFTKRSALGVDEQRVNVIIDLDDPRERWATLGDGYRVEASIRIWAAPDVLTIPASAAFRHGGGWAAYRVVGGRARLVPIAIGQRSDAQVEIRSGLQAGDTVIAYPGERVRDGSRVAARVTSAGTR